MEINSVQQNDKTDLDPALILKPNNHTNVSGNEPISIADMSKLIFSDLGIGIISNNVR